MTEPATQTQSLAAWLLERIAEDEAEVGAELFDRDESAGPNGVGWADVGAISEVLMISHRRVLADVAARRAIVALARHAQEVEGGGAEDVSSAVLRHLASVYSNHPEYRSEWAP